MNNEWISVKDKLPERNMYCWVCNSDKSVCEARYSFNSYEDSKLGINPVGFVEEGDCCISVHLEDVEYWMPYFTPEPPK